ncbi:hypothetical protein [Candidatus Sororendozoicomonas aggregata]|uniref:hypothetical protein n=1 Tax=Candidatus Sororendozoicomonas aggregata TaxID=3073239 RepID=UPI002ED18007
MNNNINRVTTAIAKTTQQLQHAIRTTFAGKSRAINVRPLLKKLLGLKQASSKPQKKPINRRSVENHFGVEPKMSRHRIKRQQASQLHTARPVMNKAVAGQPFKAPESIEQIIQNLPEPPSETPEQKSHYDFEQARQLSKPQLKALGKQLQGNDAHRFLRDLTCGAFDQTFNGDIALSNHIKIELLGKVNTGMALANNKANRLKALLLNDSLSPASTNRIERILAKTELLPAKRRSELENLIRIKRNQLQM